MYGQFIAFGSAAGSLTKEQLLASWPVPAKSEIVAPASGVIMARFTPLEITPVDPFVWSDDKQVVVSVDGYLLVDRIDVALPLSRHLRAFANLCRSEGYQAALRSIISGSFNLIVVDLARQTAYVT